MAASKTTSQKSSLASSLSAKVDGWQSRQRLERLAKQVHKHARPQAQAAPVVVFNASARLTGLSQNAAFSLLAAWSLRLAGIPVVHFVCQAGMSHCVLGTNRQDYHTPPPCEACIAQSSRVYAEAQVAPFVYREDPDLAASLSDLDVEQLAHFECPSPVPGLEPSLPLGRMVLPSIRWALRRHTLPDDEPTRYLLREYMLSAFHIVPRVCRDCWNALKPQSAVIFNGILYPEAAARWVCRQMGVRSVTHEVGFQRFSIFFTEGEATAYPIAYPDGFRAERPSKTSAWMPTWSSASRAVHHGGHPVLARDARPG